LRLFGGDPVPVRHVAVTPTMPRVPGSGYLVDLEYADRVADGSGLGDVPEVWLAAGAPADIVDRLTAQGLTIVDDDTVAGVTDRLNSEGPPAALRFQVIAGLIGLLLAAGAFTVVATVERPERAAELGALRVQGLPPRAARAVAYGGYAGLALAAVLLGAAASALAQAVTRRPVPLFIDGWGVLPVAIGPQPLPVLAALVLGVLVAGAAGVAAAARLVRAIRGGAA
jgi:putative ABC transport system permease protein